MMRAYYKGRLAADIFQMAASQRRGKEESTDAPKRHVLAKALASYCKDADESFIQPNTLNYIYACALLNKLNREEALESIFSQLPPITSNGKLRLFLGVFYEMFFFQKKNDAIKDSNELQIAKALEAKKVGKPVILIIGRGNVQGTHGAVNDLGAHYVYLTPNLFNFTQPSNRESCICSTLLSVATDDSYKNLFSQIVIDGGTWQHLKANLPRFHELNISLKELNKELLAQLRRMSNKDRLNLLMPVDRPDPSVRPPGSPCPTTELMETLKENGNASCERNYQLWHPFAARNREARDAMCGSTGASMFGRRCHLVKYREDPPANRNACDATRGSSGASMFGQKSPRPKQQQTGPGPSSSHLFSEL